MKNQIKNCAIGLLALTACGAPADGEYFGGADELGSVEQAFVGTRMKDQYGTFMQADGWRSNTFDPNSCNVDVGSDNCIVPRHSNTCMTNMWSWGDEHQAGAINDWADNKCLSGGCEDLSVNLWYGEDDTSQCDASSGFQFDYVRWNTGHWATSDWRHSSNTYMKNVVRVYAGGCKPASHTVAASITRCDHYEVQVDAAWLDAWISYWGMNQENVYRRVACYGLNITRGIGEHTTGGGCMYDRLSTGTAGNVNYRNVNSLEKIRIDNMNPTTSGNTAIYNNNTVQTF